MIRYVKGPYKCDYCGKPIKNEKAVIKFSRRGGVWGRFHLKCWRKYERENREPLPVYISPIFKPY